MGPTGWRSRSLKAAALSAVLALAGCGGKNPPPHPPHTLVGCISQRTRSGTVQTIDTRIPGAARGEPRASLAISYELGGPSDEGGKIIDAPVDTEDLYVFGGAAEARRAAAITRPAIARMAAAEARKLRVTANPQAQPEVTTVVLLGRAMLVHLAGQAFGTGSPATPGEVALARDCLAATGYG